MFTERAERWCGKWQSLTRGLRWWNTADFGFRGCILQRNVHSKGAWRRQEIYTESSGPKEGCSDPAQTPPGADRWVKRERSCLCCTVEALASGANHQTANVKQGVGLAGRLSLLFLILVSCKAACTSQRSACFLSCLCLNNFKLWLY